MIQSIIVILCTQKSTGSDGFTSKMYLKSQMLRNISSKRCSKRVWRKLKYIILKDNNKENRNEEVLCSWLGKLNYHKAPCGILSSIHSLN